MMLSKWALLFCDGTDDRDHWWTGHWIDGSLWKHLLCHYWIYGRRIVNNNKSVRWLLSYCVSVRTSRKNTWSVLRCYVFGHNVVRHCASRRSAFGQHSVQSFCVWTYVQTFCVWTLCIGHHVFRHSVPRRSVFEFYVFRHSFVRCSVLEHYVSWHSVFEHYMFRHCVWTLCVQTLCASIICVLCGRNSEVWFRYFLSNFVSWMM